MMGTPRSFSINFIEMASQAATIVPMYSAFVLDNATIGCFLLLQDMGPLLREMTNPDVDRLSTL